LEYVKKHYPIDAKRMAMLGASYGGYMANWTQVRSSSFLSSRLRTLAMWELGVSMTEWTS